MRNYNNQDAIMENIMLFSPMSTLSAIQDSFTESILADMYAEDAEIFAEFVPVRKSGKSRKVRRAIRIEQNKTHKGSDRAHGKRHGRKYLDNLPRKKFLEADNYDHFTFKVVNGKLASVKDAKTARMQSATTDHLSDCTRLDILTEYVKAEVKRTKNILADGSLLKEFVREFCKAESECMPDDAYVGVVLKDGNVVRVQLFLKYDNGNDRVYTL